MCWSFSSPDNILRQALLFAHKTTTQWNQWASNHKFETSQHTNMSSDRRIRKRYVICAAYVCGTAHCTWSALIFSLAFCLVFKREIIKLELYVGYLFLPLTQPNCVSTTQNWTTNQVSKKQKKVKRMQRILATRCAIYLSLTLNERVHS